MRILVVGADGTVGKAAVAGLKGHDIVRAGRSSAHVKVDLTEAGSIKAMYDKLGKLDAVVACTGHAHFGPLQNMTPEQFMVGVNDKLMGQVNLVLLGLPYVNDNGSFTLTTGVLDRDPIRAGVNASAVNAALNAFAMAAAIEMPRGIRINAVSPGLLEESVKKYEGFFPGHQPVSSAQVALGFTRAVLGAGTGHVIKIG
jgi:NAD(P)-dependent dehydrogenase (short-subunit alcohol dehydrogenase family)